MVYAGAAAWRKVGKCAVVMGAGLWYTKQRGECVWRENAGSANTFMLMTGGVPTAGLPASSAEGRAAFSAATIRLGRRPALEGRIRPVRIFSSERIRRKDKIKSSRIFSFRREEVVQQTFSGFGPEIFTADMINLLRGHFLLIAVDEKVGFD